MNRLLMALALYVGLGFFFAINAVAILRGAPMLTAVGKGFVALLSFALLGLVAGFVARGGSERVDKLEDVPESPTIQDA